MSFQDRLAIVALAMLEGLSPQAVDGLKPGTLEARALERLQVVPGGARVRRTLESLGAWPRSLMRVVVAVAVLLVSLGLAAVVSASHTVSVPAVLVGTLGVQTLLLIAWLMALMPGVGALVRGSLARLITGPIRAFAALGGEAADALPEAAAALKEWTGRRRRQVTMDHAASVAATSALAIAYAPQRSPMAALVYGAWSNAAWVAANILVLGLLALRLLGSRNYTLHSGLLSPEVTRAWVESVVWVLSVVMHSDWLPDADAMARAAAEPAGVATDSWRWGAMLVASVAVFGLLPRLLALTISLLWLPIVRRRWRIPWNDPALAATRAVIEASRPPATVVARERPAESGGPAAAARRASPGESPCVVRLGPVSPWTPVRPSIDLGSLDSQGLAGAEAIARRVGSEHLGPVLVLIDLSGAPRRGMLDYLAPLSRACVAARTAVLSEGSRLRRGTRCGDLALVVDAWRSLVQEAGFERVTELDLALRTSRSGARLEALLTDHSVEVGRAGLLEAAVHRIIDMSVELGERVPGAAEERRLLDSLGRHYGIDGLCVRAPFVCVLSDASGAWWKPGLDRARLAVTGGPHLIEASLGAPVRSTMLVNAMMVAVELECQGCGELAITKAMERTRDMLEEMEAGRCEQARFAGAIPAWTTNAHELVRRLEIVLGGIRGTSGGTA